MSSRWLLFSTGFREYCSKVWSYVLGFQCTWYHWIDLMCMMFNTTINLLLVFNNNKIGYIFKIFCCYHLSLLLVFFIQSIFTNSTRVFCISFKLLLALLILLFIIYMFSRSYVRIYLGYVSSRLWRRVVSCCSLLTLEVLFLIRTWRVS